MLTKILQRRTAPTKNYLVQNVSTRSRKSWSGRAPKLGGGKPTMRIGRNFNFSLYSVWTIQVFSDCACVTSIKIHKKNILIRTFMLPIVTILWDMNIFQNLEKAGDFFFFFKSFSGDWHNQDHQKHNHG